MIVRVDKSLVGKRVLIRKESAILATPSSGKIDEVAGEWFSICWDGKLETYWYAIEDYDVIEILKDKITVPYNQPWQIDPNFLKPIYPNYRWTVTTNTSDK